MEVGERGQKRKMNKEERIVVVDRGADAPLRKCWGWSGSGEAW